MPPIRLLLVDDQQLVREGLSSLLGAQPHLDVIGQAENGREAIALVRTLRPDVVLMDVRMPVMDGVAATQSLQAEFPQVKVLVLTTFDDDEYLSQALHHGAKGYLLKDTPAAELAAAIQAVHGGASYLGPGLLDKMLGAPPTPPSPAPPELAELTPREREVLACLGAGCSNREIAQVLYISERTVKNHVSRILHCLNLRDRTQAALLAAALQLPGPVLPEDE
ncbi:MAG: response regulator transcription factor [Cyanobacteria bacterium J06641_5]